MPNRSRNYEVYETDDDYSSYMEVPAVSRPRSRSKLGLRYDPRLDPNIVIHQRLDLPDAPRQRASSTGAPPQPNYIPVLVPQSERDVSQTRIKNYRKGRRDSDETDSDDSDRKSSRKYRRSRSKSEYEMLLRLLQEQKNEKAALDPALIDRLAQLKAFEEEKKRQDDEKRLRELLAEQKKLDEQGRKPSVPAELAAQLEQFKYEKEKRAREDEQAALIAKMQEDERKRKEREEKMLYDYQEGLRKKKAAEEDAITRAEAARAKADAEAKAERERFLAVEKERAAQAALKEKAERARILAETKSQAAAEKAEMERILAEHTAKIEKEKKEAAEERLRILAEEREKAEKAKKAAEAERKRILAEEEERKKKEKAEYEEMRDRVLATEKKKEEEAKAKKKAEDDAFKARVKEQFKEAGYSPEYIEGILDKKEKKEKNAMALEAARPTYIRVQIRHLLPETLDYYHLPWEYDPHDERYLLIKEYITHELQQELFQHTKRIFKQRETRLITADSGYTKETVTTLRPNIYKDKDKNEMFLVRRKSTGKSPSRPSRNSWMFS